ncbi:MAG: MFS transporter, partial [Chloroflexota bacterium]
MTTTNTTQSKITTSPLLLEAVVILVAVLGTSMVNIDTTAVNVALPSIQQSFGLDIGGVQWIVDSFLLTIATLLLITGALGDLYGRVHITSLGAIIFSIASLVSGLAPSFEVLLVSRTVQGIGGALLAPGGLAIINAIVAPERRSRLLGRWVTLTTMVIALGPLLGGWLVDNVSWRFLFFINVPLGILCFVVARRFIPESRDEDAANKSLDWPGAIALTIGLGGLLFVLIEGSRFGWTSSLILGMCGASIIGLCAFVAIEQYSPNPMLPLRFFQNRTFTGINLLTAIYFMAFGGQLFFLTLNLLQVQGFSAFATGLSILPVTIAIFALGTPSGILTDHWGPRPMIIIGILIT